MFDLITIGNTTIDLYFLGEDFTFKDGRFQLALNGKYFAKKLIQKIGGGATNVAIGCKKNGLNVSLISVIGEKPFQEIIINNLKSDGIDYHWSRFIKTEVSLSSILLADKGKRTIINYPAKSYHFFDPGKDLEILLNAKFVYLGNTPNVSVFTRGKILQFLKKNHIRSVVNFSMKACKARAKHLDPFLDYIDIIIINTHEFSELIGKRYKDLDFSKNLVDQFLPMLSDNIVVVTDGEKGSYGYQNGNVYFQKAEKIKKIIDTTGTGDAYTAGFIAFFYRENNLEKAMEAGTKYVAKILGNIGAN